MWQISLVGSACSVLAFLAMVATAVRRQRLQRQQRLIETAPPSERARLIELALDRFGIATNKLDRGRQADVVLERLRQRSERFRWALIASTGLFIVSLAALTGFALRHPALYQIRVTVLGLDRQPTDDSQLRSSVDGVLKQLAGGWELEIPKAKRPAEGHVTLWATKGPLSCPPVKLELGSNYTPSIELQLERVETQVRGLVVNQSNEAIVGARVLVVGFEDDGTDSGPNGGFVLNAHAAKGERVRIRAEKSGYQTRDQAHLAGRAPVTLVLETDSKPSKDLPTGRITP